MNQVLRLLRSSRDARKEAALGKLAAAQGRLKQAQAELQAANVGFQEAQLWRLELLRRNGAGLGKDWRHTMLPSCQALLQLRGSAMAKAVKQVQEQDQAVQACRAALTLCEKALLRTDELQHILKEQADETLRLTEQSQDDDLAIARGGQVRSPMPAVTSHLAAEDATLAEGSLPWK
jgi:cellobiose-specific phosphotransferase system component IIA